MISDAAKAEAEAKIEAKAEAAAKAKSAAVAGARKLKKQIRAFQVLDDLTVSQWADKFRRLSPESSAEAGPWRTKKTPYLKEVMDAFTDPKIRHIVMVAASQVGKSEAMNNIIGYIIDQDPGSILMIEPTNGDA